MKDAVNPYVFTEQGVAMLSAVLHSPTAIDVSIGIIEVDVRTINEHLKNIYKQNELIEEATIRKFRIVQREGNRNIARNL